MTLANFTSLGLIVPRLRGHDLASVIQELSQALLRENRIHDLLPFYQTALNREFMVGSDTEYGMAFPHARLPGLTELCFALGRSDQPLKWRINGGGLVKHVFLMAIPATESTQSLLLVSSFVRLAKDAQLIGHLSTAEEPRQILEVLQQIELRSTSGTKAAPEKEGRHD